MGRFTLPRDIYYGTGSVEELRNLSGQKAMIVTGGSSMRKLGFLELVCDILENAGFETRIYDNVEPDPGVETVQKGAQAMRDFGPDWIVSIGGGSAIDAAKAMWVFYEYPDVKFEQLCVPFSFPTLRQKARFCAIPSTSGTATEVTAFSVITDYNTGIKYPLADFNITPDVAILDAQLALSMPKTLTAYTGMDAFTHAAEAYVSTAASDFTDPLALKALCMVREFIMPSLDGDAHAREKMHTAQCLAGMAFSNALLGIVHSMAHKTGAAFENGHVVHGCANAIYLPYVVAYNAKDDRAKSRYADIARAMQLPGGTDGDLVQSLIEEINRINKSLGIPSCLKDYDEGMVSEQEFLEKLPTVALLAIGDACTGSNPRKITHGEMQQLLKACYYGTQVNF